MSSLERFETNRRHLRGMAYRMLGSSADADDAVQDTWLKWQGVDPNAIADDRAWLTTVLVRACLDRLGSARARRETYPGPWLPEPVFTTAPLDLESISLGFLVLLERLTPVERAVFLLHQVFDYTHAEVAEILGINEAATRQTLHRAREHVAGGRPRFEPDRDAQARLLGAFVGALAKGEVAPIAALLRDDAVLYADGGGKVRGAAAKPVTGSGSIARFFAGLVRTFGSIAELSTEIREINGAPALVGRVGAAPLFVLTIETDGARIATIRNVVNPDKLALRSFD